MIRKVSLFILIVFAALTFFSNVIPAQESHVYVVPVKGQIEPGFLTFLERSLNEASDTGAAAVILEIDTPGGYIDTAQEARLLMDRFPAPVYSYVKPHALSAGAYLALAADALYMAPGSTIGAAEPRIMGVEVTDEKLVSAWDAEMRGVAENQGKDPLLAAAMVRKEIEIEGVVSSGELLTLTAMEAERLGFADGTPGNISQLLEFVGLEGAEVIRVSPTFWENLSSWLIKPPVATAILTMAFLFLILEVLTAGFGIAGLFSILCFGLYFGGHYFTGVSGWPAIFLFIFGMILLLTEAFVPGLGVFGLGGLVSVTASIVMSAASTEIGLKMLLVSLIVSIIAGYLAFKYFQRRGILRRFILLDAATKELGYSSSADLQYLVGKTGISVTPLRPSGIAEIEESRFDVVTEGSFIPSGAAVLVVRTEGRRVVVRTKI